MNSFTPTSMAIALALCLSGVGITTVHAQARAPRAGTSDSKELVAARADLARAAKRVAELSGTPEVRVERRVVDRPVLGVLLTPDERDGVRIAGVTPGSGAAKAGLKSGDRIVSVDGREVLGSSGELRLKNLRKLLGEMDGKSATKIGYARDGRTATVAVTPQAERQMFVWSDGDGKPMKLGGEGGVLALDADDFDFDFDFDVDAAMAGIAPEIHREIARIDGACKAGGCRAPMLLSAFRWNGLNLAAVDAQLGRYFGTDHGVLVLSSGELKELQAGDVIQRIDGRPVGDPGAAMAALRGKADGAKVAVEYLRDRRTGKTQVTVPKLMSLPNPPTPPAPPAPPAAPKAPPAPPAPPASKTASAPKATAPGVPPAPPAPPPPPVAPDLATGFTFIGEDGRVFSFAATADERGRAASTDGNPHAQGRSGTR